VRCLELSMVADSGMTPDAKGFSLVPERRQGGRLVAALSKTIYKRLTPDPTMSPCLVGHVDHGLRGPSAWVHV
jgi:hypothetical protein